MTLKASCITRHEGKVSRSWMGGLLRACGADWKYSAECGLSVHSNLLDLMCAKFYWLL